MGEFSEVAYGYTCPCKNNGRIIGNNQFKEIKLEKQTVTTTTTTTAPKTTTTDLITTTKSEAIERSGACQDPMDAMTQLIDPFDPTIVGGGEWRCAETENRRKVRCNSFCNDGYEPKSVLICKLSTNHWVIHERHSNLSCEPCSEDSLHKSEFGKPTGGTWNCYDDRRSHRVCEIDCNEPGKTADFEVKCRNNKEWKRASLKRTSSVCR